MISSCSCRVTDPTFGMKTILHEAERSAHKTIWPRPPSRYDSNNGSVARPQLPLEPNKKRRVESVGVSGGGSFPTSSSKRPRTLKRSKDVIQETLSFACPLYKLSTLDLHLHLIKLPATPTAVCANNNNNILQTCRWSANYPYKQRRKGVRRRHRYCRKGGRRLMRRIRTDGRR
jgi:hypothetical protein